MIVKVDRKTAREQYVAGKTITVFDKSIPDSEREVFEFSCRSDIKDASKVRRFNRIVKTFSDYVGVPSFWLGKIDWWEEKKMEAEEIFNGEFPIDCDSEDCGCPCFDFCKERMYGVDHFCCEDVYEAYKQEQRRRK